MMYFATAHVSLSGSTTPYDLIWIVVGLFALLGAGGAYGIIKWIKKTGVRDAKIDELLHPETGVLQRLKKMEQQGIESGRQISDLTRSTRANGLTTDQVGDIAKRTEIAVNEIRDKVLLHIGSSESEHKTMWKAIQQKQDKVS